MRRHVSHLFFAGVLVVSVACGPGPSDNEGMDDVEDPVEPFARIDLGDGNLIEYREPEGGLLTDSHAFRSEALRNEYLAMAGQSPLEIYEHFSDQQPTEEVVQKLALVMSVVDDEEGEPMGEPSAADPTLRHKPGRRLAL